MGIREKTFRQRGCRLCHEAVKSRCDGRVSDHPVHRDSSVFLGLRRQRRGRYEFIPVESEHSAMSTCIGAQAAGCRAVSATSS